MKAKVRRAEIKSLRDFPLEVIDSMHRFELALRHRDWSIKLLRAEIKLLRLKLQEPSKVTF